MAYAVPTSANFTLNHKRVGTIAASGTFWLTTDYAQKLVKFSKEINAVLRITTDLSDTESLQTIEQVMDNLLWQDFMYDLVTQKETLLDTNIVPPSLWGAQNAYLRDMLRQIMTGDDEDDAPAMTRAMGRGTNNNGLTLD